MTLGEARSICLVGRDQVLLDRSGHCERGCSVNEAGISDQYSKLK